MVPGIILFDYFIDLTLDLMDYLNLFYTSIILVENILFQTNNLLAKKQPQK